jgi:hypothetical protein
LKTEPRKKTGGRKAGVPNKATAEIKAIAQQYGPRAIEVIAEIMEKSADPKARVSAANSLLDRGYGKPAQTIIGDKENPLEHNVTGLDEFTRRIAAMATKGDGNEND